MVVPMSKMLQQDWQDFKSGFLAYLKRKGTHHKRFPKKITSRFLRKYCSRFDTVSGGRRKWSELWPSLHRYIRRKKQNAFRSSTWSFERYGRYRWVKGTSYAQPV